MVAVATTAASGMDAEKVQHVRVPKSLQMGWKDRANERERRRQSPVGGGAHHGIGGAAGPWSRAGARLAVGGCVVAHGRTHQHHLAPRVRQ